MDMPGRMSMTTKSIGSSVERPICNGKENFYRTWVHFVYTKLRSGCKFFKHIWGPQKCLSEGHMNYDTTIRGPNILRNVIISGYVIFYQINKCFVNLYFFVIDKMSLRPVEMASQAVVWKPLKYITRDWVKKLMDAVTGPSTGCGSVWVEVTHISNILSNVFYF